MTRKPLTVVDVTKLDWNQLQGLYDAGFDVSTEMASRPEGQWAFLPVVDISLAEFRKMYDAEN